MDFIELKKKYQGTNKDWSARSTELLTYEMVLDGTIYNCMKYPFYKVSDNQENLPMSKRRPSVKYRLAKIITNQTIGLLFGEGHFPQIQYEKGDEAFTEQQEILDEIIKKSKLNKTMLESAYLGSVGSIVIVVRNINGKIMFETVKTAFLTPTFDPNDPSRLIKLVQRYRVTGAELYEMGYENCDVNCNYWYQWELNEDAEIYYEPMLCEDAAYNRSNMKKFLNKISKGDTEKPKQPKIDKKNSPVPHELGFIPAVWIKNLPGKLGHDGLCTFEPAIDFNIEIDYQLSQGGRGLRYSSDPLLAIKNGIGTANINPGEGNVIELDENGDIKFAEISGDAVRAVLEYVSVLRDMAIECVNGDRTNPEKITMTHSGKAAKMMKQALLFVSDELRTTYGEDGLVDLITIIINMNQKYMIVVNGKDIPVGTFKSDANINLIWPDWFPQTTQDKQEEAGTLKTLKDSGLISQKTAVSTIQKGYDIVSVDEEIGNIEEDQAKLLANQPKITEVIQA